MGRALPIALALLALAAPAAAQERDRRGAPARGPILAVKGEGVAKLEPEFATFRVYVETKAKTLEDAAAPHPALATKGLEILRGFASSGLAISSSDFTLRDHRPYRTLRQGEVPPEPEFQARTTYDLRLKSIDRLNDVVTGIVGSSLFRSGSLSFGVEDQRAALNLARTAAMRDAREQAAAYAQAGDIDLVETLEIADGEAQPLSEGKFDLPNRLPSETLQIIPPKAVTFSASVNVTWRIKSRR